jgi:hypothetical protein
LIALVLVDACNVTGATAQHENGEEVDFDPVPHGDAVTFNLCDYLSAEQAVTLVGIPMQRGVHSLRLGQ